MTDPIVFFVVLVLGIVVLVAAAEALVSGIEWLLRWWIRAKVRRSQVIPFDPTGAYTSWRQDRVGIVSESQSRQVFQAMKPPQSAA